MNKVLRIVGIILLVWIALIVVGALVGFIVKTVMWIALIAGVAVAVTAVAGRSRKSVGHRR